MTLTIALPEHVQDLINKARHNLIGYMMTPPVVKETDYKKSLKAMATEMGISPEAALKYLLTGDLT